MRILLVHNTYQQPGGEDVVFRQERDLLERAGHQVLTYCRSNREIDGRSRLEKWGLVGRMVWARDTYREVTALLISHPPDLVHIHNTFLMVSPSIYAACIEARVPVVQTLHNFRLFCPGALFFREERVCEECLTRGLWQGVSHACYRQSRAATAAVALALQVHRLLRTQANAVDAYVPLTEFARQKFIACGLPAERMFTKPNFVYPDPGARTEPGTGATFIGRLSPEKGVETLLRAWSRLQNPVPLRIVGEGPQRPRLEANLNGLRRHVSFLGQVSRGDATAALKASRFLVFPSQCYESFPLSIVEAFACGVPVIAARLGAAQEIVADGKTGLHYDPGDPDDLAQKVEWACSHPEEMDAMGRAARALYQAKYTAEQNYEQLMQIYQAATAMHGVVRTLAHRTMARGA